MNFYYFNWTAKTGKGVRNCVGSFLCLKLCFLCSLLSLIVSEVFLKELLPKLTGRLCQTTIFI